LSKIAIGVAVVGLIVMVAFNWLAGLIVVLAAIAIPVGGYLMLDPSQRRRLRDIQRRKQIDR
jgi:ABC-type transport system involved in cytochrome bd biosynthesis fused ATPase/permease subunit